MENFESFFAFFLAVFGIFSTERGDFAKLNSAFGRARRIVSWSTLVSPLSESSWEILESARKIS
jgi:hypothetical protein